MATVTVLNADAGLSGKTLINAEDAQNVSGTKSFNRSPNAPFVVQAGSANVPNLDADKLDGLDSTYFLSSSNQSSGALPVARLIIPDICQGRLTLTSGTPVTTADVTGAASVFFTPYKGNLVALYDGSTRWNTYAFTEKTLALGTLTNDLPYDVFVYDNSGVPALEALAWSSKTTRATALTTQDGVLVKTGATTRRYLGTFHTTATTTTEDSAAKRLLYNYYNRVPRPCKKLVTANYNYSLATWRQSNGDSANQVAIVVGWAESRIFLNGATVILMGASNADVASSIGEDSTTTPDASVIGGANRGTSIYLPVFSQLTKMPAVGYHFYAMLEYSQAAGTQNWQPTLATNINYGLSGSIEA